MQTTPHLLAARAALRVAAATLPVAAAVPKLVPLKRAASLGLAREAHATWLRALNVPSTMRLNPLPEVLVSDVLASAVSVDVSPAALSGATGLRGVASRFMDSAARWALSLGSRLASFAAVAAPVVARVAVGVTAAAVVGIALYQGVRHFTLSPARGGSQQPSAPSPSPPRPALIGEGAVAAAVGPSAVAELLMCPISQMEMVDPVVTHDGFTYERTSIEQWFSLGHHTSPMTGLPLASLELTPNFAMAQLITARHEEAAMAAAASSLSA